MKIDDLALVRPFEWLRDLFRNCEGGRFINTEALFSEEELYADEAQRLDDNGMPRIKSASELYYEENKN